MGGLDVLELLTLLLLTLLLLLILELVEVTDVTVPTVEGDEGEAKVPLKLTIGRRSDWSVAKKRENGSIGAPELLLPLTLALLSLIVSSRDMIDPVLGPLLDGKNCTVPPVVNSPVGDP